MKRFLLMVLVLCLLPLCACADNFEEFSEYAMVFGSLPPIESTATQEDIYTIYTVSNCKITFKGEESIFVQGDGIDFLAYCLSAIMTFEPESSQFRDNAGLLFGNYLLSRDGTMKTWDTAGGLTALIQKDETEVIFAVGK